jgi:putative oxidoreductase
MSTIKNSFAKLFFDTDESLSLTFLRFIAALVIFPHGAQKLLGWFGGYGVTGTLGFFSQMGISPFLGMLDILAESVGAILLAAGLLTRLSAFGTAVTMIVAVLTVHISNGFFMNWSGHAAGEGFEYHILYLAIVLVLLVKGGGAYSLDKLIALKAEKKKETKQYELIEAK